MTTSDFRVPTSHFAALALSLCFLLASCSSDPTRGYSFASTYPQDIKTVSVPIFDNYTFSTGIETELTEAIIKEIQKAGSIRVTSSEDSDTRLTGVVTGADMRRITLARRTGLVQEQALQLTVDFEWMDKRSGKTLISRKNFAAVDTFIPARPTGEPIEVGQHAVVQRLARDIVREMRSTW